MEDLQVIHEFSEKQLTDVISIIYDAFRKKIDKLELKPKSELQGRQIMFESVDPEQIMILLNKNEVVGGLGFQTHDKKFYHFKWSLLKIEFGFFGAISRALYQFIGKERIKPSELYIGAVAISKNHRGKGYGTFLMNYILQCAKLKEFCNQQGILYAPAY